MAGKFSKFLEFIGITENDQNSDDDDYNPEEEEEYVRGRGRNRRKEEPDEPEDNGEPEEEEEERGSRSSFLNRNKHAAKPEGVEERFPKGSARVRETTVRTESRPAYNPQMKVIVYHPVSFEDTQNVIDNVKEGKPVIVNLTESDEASAIRVLDFLSGATYALDGNMCRVAGGIFFISPQGCDVVGGDDGYEQAEEPSDGQE